MADVSTGTDSASLKAMLRRAKGDAPANCGVATPKDGPFALLMVDKIKPARALSGELEKSFAGAKAPRWGTVYPDTNRADPVAGAPEEAPPDAKLLLFTMNKPAPGLAKRLIKTLKLNKTGFSKVELRFEDGSEPERHAEEDEEGDAPAAAPAAAAPAAPTQPAPTQPAPARPAATAAPPAQPANADAAEVAAARHQLETLIPRIAASAGADAGRRAELTKLAQAVGAAVKGGDASAARRLVGALETALEAAPGGAKVAAAPKVAASAPAVTGIPAGVVAYGKARLTWLAVRKKMHTDLDSLRAALLAHYKGDTEIMPSLQQAYDDRIEPVLEAMDEALADRLDDAINATDPAERARLVGAATEEIRRYQAFVAADPTLAAMDGNPLLPLSLRQTLDTTLGALAKAVH